MPETTSKTSGGPRSTSLPKAGHEQPPEHGVSIELPCGARDIPPTTVRTLSAPAYQSPIRHHRRGPSKSSGVKETLNARSHYESSDDDGTAVHRINQYIIKQEIGRGSFGSVHLAEDQYGQEYAVKEFSKSRLRKRAQSNLLRKPGQPRRSGHLAAGRGFNSPLHRLSSQDGKIEANNSLELIKEEIAIMKKLHHNNLAALIEVLDDPQEDSLYMVLELCKKGVAMKVGLDEHADPYDDETCRCWFRDMILGIEYLHAQGIVHRDIKPDNCLITNDDVLKIVDFGVSEMFEKLSDMSTSKSAGSPAFMPPELCVAKHGQISGRAADIWSMGVTLYCFRYGHIPFEKGNMLDLYECIRSDDVQLAEESDADFQDLMRRILEKDPEKRIVMDDLRAHPWVTKKGTDPLLSAEENCADLIEPPTELEMNHAITGNMAHVLAVMGAVKRFKHLLDRKGGRRNGLFGSKSKIFAPPQAMNPRSKSQETDDRRAFDKILVTAGVHREIEVDDEMQKLPLVSNGSDLHNGQSFPASGARSGAAGHETEAVTKQQIETGRHPPNLSPVEEQPAQSEERRSNSFPLANNPKGHAHDPLLDQLYLGIGNHSNAAKYIDDDDEVNIVSESPPAVEYDIYEEAYQEEMKKILDRRGKEPSMYMTRRISHRDDIRMLANIKDAGKFAARSATDALSGLYASRGRASEGLSSLVERARASARSDAQEGAGAHLAKAVASNTESTSYAQKASQEEGTSEPPTPRDRTDDASTKATIASSPAISASLRKGLGL